MDTLPATDVSKPMSQYTTYEMKLKVDHVLLRVLPEGDRRRSSPDFPDQVSSTLRKLLNEVGGLITSMSVEKEEVRVSWKSEGTNPLAGIVKLLEKARYNEAVLLLELFKSARPDNTDLLYNLGMAYSDMGELERARTNLHRLLELMPDHVNGRVAMGVALMRQGQDKPALVELRQAVQDDPNNPWAQRNLGSCLLRLREYQEALRYLKRSTELNPSDERAWFGLGQAYELTGNINDADAAYRKVLEIDEYSETAELAREASSRIAQTSFHSATPGMERMDAVMYCLGALEKYEKMTPESVRQVGLEVAMIGMNGLTVNDPTPKYQLKSLPGTFSGLHLVCLEYVSFKQVAPEMDIGFDLSAEYRSAQALFVRKNQGE
jgi:Flp pilus assembly protein TadD